MSPTAEEGDEVGDLLVVERPEVVGPVPPLVERRHPQVRPARDDEPSQRLVADQGEEGRVADRAGSPRRGVTPAWRPFVAAGASPGEDVAPPRGVADRDGP